MARGYQLTFARESLDLGELAELFSILDEIYVTATVASAASGVYRGTLGVEFQPNLIPSRTWGG
jgi:hypothetical protein